MWFLLATALALPLPQVPDDDDAAEAWVEPWAHAGLADRDELDVAVHFVPAGTAHWRLQVRRDGDVAREVRVDRPTSAGDREELAFLALGLLRDLEEADAVRPVAPRPVAPPPPPPLPAPAPRPKVPLAKTPLEVGWDATLVVVDELPLPTGASAKVSSELLLPDLDPDELLAPEERVVPEPSHEPERTRRVRLAHLAVLGGVDVTSSASDPAFRLGLRTPLWEGRFLSWQLDVGMLPRSRWFATPRMQATTFQGEARTGIFVNHPWLVVGTQMGLATRAFSQDWERLANVLIPQMSSVTGVRIGPIQAEVELVQDLVRVDARMPDQSMNRGSAFHGRFSVGVVFGKRSDPKPEATTSLVQNEEML